MFHIFNSSAEGGIISPQLARFESKTYKQIEENIQKEILDYSSTEDPMGHHAAPSLLDNCAVNAPVLEGTESLQ